MTKALCTVAVGSHLDLLPYALPTFEVFADRHGYELVAPREVAAGLHPCWEKLRLVRELLDDHEQVLWVDADAVIADPSRDVFEDMDTDRSWGWVMHVSGNTLLPNAGVLALRAEPPALEIVDRAWARRDRYANHPGWSRRQSTTSSGLSRSRRRTRSGSDSDAADDRRPVPRHRVEQPRDRPGARAANQALHRRAARASAGRRWPGTQPRSRSATARRRTTSR